MRRDNPTWDFDETYAFGGRIMGQTGNFNWTLLVWNRLADTPTPNADGIALGQTYALAGLGSMLLGLPYKTPPFPDEKCFDFKRYTTIGGTVMTEWPWLHYTTWDLEWFYEIASPLPRSTTGKTGDIFGVSRKDIFGFSLKVGDRFRMPDFMNNLLGTTKKVDWTFTYFYEKVFSHEHDMVLNDRYHKQKDSVSDGVSFWCKVELFNSSFAFVYLASYYLQTGGQMHVPSLVYYFPTSILNGGLRFTIGAKMYARPPHDAMYTTYDKKDSLILRLSYEF